VAGCVCWCKRLAHTPRAPRTRAHVTAWHLKAWSTLCHLHLTPLPALTTCPRPHLLRLKGSPPPDGLIYVVQAPPGEVSAHTPALQDVRTCSSLMLDSCHTPLPSLPPSAAFMVHAYCTAAARLPYHMLPSTIQHSTLPGRQHRTHCTHHRPTARSTTPQAPQGPGSP